MTKIIEIQGLFKKFQDKEVFTNFSMEIEKGSFNIIIGESGSGKSTLLNMIGLLDKADKGTISLFGKKNVKPFSREAELLLRDKIGYLFQNFALIENESVEYNLKIALASTKDKNNIHKINEALETVGLKNFNNKRIYKCSGGEQQRVAIARLLLKPCELILADEPTGSLDAHNKDLVFQLLKKLQILGKTLIVVTHDQDLMPYADNIIYINK